MTLLSTCALATTGLGVLAPAASAAPAGPLVQAEGLRALSGRVLPFADATASGGRALAMLTNAAVRTTMTTTTAADRLVLRVRGDHASGAPRADVLVDGQRVGSVSVPSTRWVDAVLPGSWAAGQHTVEVRFVNDALVAGRDRNLRLDRVTFGARTAASSATATSESRVLQLVNAERAAVGLRPLAPLACATGVARDWSATMARTGTFAHRDLDAVRAACAAHSLLGWGENIAFGDRMSADAMMKMWMESPGHRANILSKDWTHVGVGIAVDGAGRVYGTQDFYKLG
jgi:uncharacterized protein YkwD